MSDTMSLLYFEEGYRELPYYDSLGYPTAGIGQRLGPKGAALSLYQFKVPLLVAKVWVESHLDELVEDIETKPAYGLIRSVLDRLRREASFDDYSDARISVLLSMGYQMGLDGLADFKNTLGFMLAGDYDKAATNMLLSKWAKQTPNRAKRHADQMRSGNWAKEY